MPERILDRLPEGVKIPVADIDVFLIKNADSVAFLARHRVPFLKVREIVSGRIVIIIQCPGIGQPAARALAAVQQFHEGIACAHARKAGVDRRFDMVGLHPAHVDRITGVDNGQCPVKNSTHCRNHCLFCICQIIAALDGLVVQKLSRRP